MDQTRVVDSLRLKFQRAVHETLSDIMDPMRSVKWSILLLCINILTIR